MSASGPLVRSSYHAADYHPARRRREIERFFALVKINAGARSQKKGPEFSERNRASRRLRIGKFFLQRLDNGGIAGLAFLLQIMHELFFQIDAVPAGSAYEIAHVARR